METVKIGLSDGVKYLLTLLSIAIILLLFFCLDNQSKIIEIKRELLYMHTEKISQETLRFKEIEEMPKPLYTLPAANHLPRDMKNPVIRCDEKTGLCSWESCPLTK